MRSTRYLLAPLLAVCLGTGLTAQSPAGRLSVDAIYHPERRVNFSGTLLPDPVWLDDQTFVATYRKGPTIEWLRTDGDSGGTSVFLTSTALVEALERVAPGPDGGVARAVAATSPTFNRAHTALLVSVDDDLYYYDIARGAGKRLTRTPGIEEEATFSPDGRFVAFVRNNDLHIVSVEGSKERSVTSDGGPQLLNGKLDWLYQEEIYGRGRFRGYWWSPDSSRVAFLQLDERPVPSYTVVDHIPYRPALEVTDYPKAGDPNPRARLGVARVARGGPIWVDLDEYRDADLLIVNVDWTPDSASVVHQIQDREQTWLDLRVADAQTGRARRVLRETTPAWVNENGNPSWLPDGSFLWLSERNGFRHVYRYRLDGTLIGQVTTGRWEVRSLYGVDRAERVYFAAPERDALSTDIYRIGLTGEGLARLSQTPGTHRAVFNPGLTAFVDTWSDVNTPPQTRLHRADGTEVRVLNANPVPTLARVTLGKPEFVQVRARDGFMLDAMLIRPPDFDPTKRYPVFQYTYAGPTAAVVRNRWGGNEYLFQQLLAQHGFLVWAIDNRSASGKGAEAQWPVYGRLGEMELLDLEDGITWLKRQPFVDASRVLLYGWSYGGFMAAYALTHSTSWSAGIVGAPVSDWRDYDSVYTERLMKLPSRNEEGYRRAAPRFAASQLHGRMLLIHGTMDDNVHFQNSVQFAYELQRAGKPFETMIYPRSRHAVADPLLNTHLRQLMVDFTIRALEGHAPGS